MDSKAEKDAYFLLGIRGEAGEDEIKKAFRKKSLKLHPDKNPNDPKAKKKFQKLKEAYDFLLRTLKRREQRKREEQQNRIAGQLGSIGGAGHFYQSDRSLTRGKGFRDAFTEPQIRKLLNFLAVGATHVNLKFLWADCWNIEEAGWKIEFANGQDEYGESWVDLSFQDKDGTPFTVVAQEIAEYSGTESNRQELGSSAAGARQVIKYKRKAGFAFVRFNISFL